MGQNSPRKDKNDKGLSYVTSLCSGTPQQPEQQSNGTQKQNRRNTMNGQKMQYLLNPALLKLSSRNLQVQEFPSNFQIHQLLQQHITSRIHHLRLILFHGQFSHKFLNSVSFPIQSVQSSQSTYDLSPQTLFNTHNFNLKLRNKSLEAIIFGQTNNTLKLIENVLKNHSKTADHFIFIAEAGIEATNYEKLFRSCKDQFLFQVQKILMLDKCIATIIYLSTSRQFLLVNNESLASFFVEQLHSLEPTLDKRFLQNLIIKLFQANLYLQTAGVLRELKIAPKTVNHIEEQFLLMMNNKHPESKDIIAECVYRRMSNLSNSSQSTLPRFHKNTPEFQFTDKREAHEEKKPVSMPIGKRINFISFGAQQIREQDQEFL